MDKRIPIAIGSVALAYLIIITAFYIPYYDSNFYNVLFQANKVHEKVEGASEIFEDLKEYYDKDYFGYERTHLIEKFSDNEQSHIKDVKRIIDWICILYYLSIILLISSVLFLLYSNPKEKKENIGTMLIWGGGISFDLVFIIAMVALTNFNGGFDFFHRMFFPQGNWSFGSGSLLISMFPINFFISFVKRAAIISLIISIISLITGIMLRKK